MITTTLQVEFGPVGGFVHVCMPYSMIEPIRDLLSNPVQGEVEVDKRWVKQMSQQVQSADVELSADFVTIPSTIGELIEAAGRRRAADRAAHHRHRAKSTACR